ncbi:MAG: tol-pal system protein YbgF [Rhizomicrobium sp.]
MALVAIAAAPGQAVQPPQDTSQLTARIAKDQIQIRKLQAELSQTQDALEQSQEDSGNLVKVAGLFGESDEEKAERLKQQQHEQNQDSNINTLSQRIGDLEESMRRLTGQMEQLEHKVNEFNDRVARMQKDYDYKLCTIAAQQLGATDASSDQNALSCQGQQGSAQPDTGAVPPSNGSSQRLGNPSGILGTLPQNALANTASPTQLTPPGQQSGTDTRVQFDAAMNLLAKAQYDEARAAFRAFADSYPKDDLASQAIYWVGDIAYVQKDYATASRVFAEEIQKFPRSPRAPESMLKLGQSLLAMNQKKEGCLALGALPGRYPNASKTVTDQARDIRHTAGCR